MRLKDVSNKNVALSELAFEHDTIDSIAEDFSYPPIEECDIGIYMVSFSNWIGHVHHGGNYTRTFYEIVLSMKSHGKDVRTLEEMTHL